MARKRQRTNWTENYKRMITDLFWPTIEHYELDGICSQQNNVKILSILFLMHEKLSEGVISFLGYSNRLPRCFFCKPMTKTGLII